LAQRINGSLRQQRTTKISMQNGSGQVKNPLKGRSIRIGKRCKHSRDDFIFADIAR
jgi:hypothetical protein